LTPRSVYRTSALQLASALKIVRNKPADLVEGCTARDANATFIPQTLVREQEASTPCNQLYPSNSFAREVAGADIAADIVKCERKAVQRSDYAVTFDDAQWARLNAIFPTGVCDWSRRGVEQQDPDGTWLRYD
jgi:hypothetical protein